MTESKNERLKRVVAKYYAEQHNSRNERRENWFTHHPYDFEITQDMCEKLNAWDKCRHYYQGVSGGHMSFTFIPTSIGIIVKAKCSSCNEELDLTDYNW